MQRLYYLADDMDAASHLSTDLISHGVQRHQLHLVANREAELWRRNLPAANPLHTTDVVPASEGGLLAGLSLGIVACVLVYTNRWLISADGLAYVGLLIFCTCLGTWLGGFVGLSLRHYKLVAFQPALDQGRVLVMVDVDQDRAADIARFMSHHPDAQPAGHSSNWNNPLHIQ